MSLVICIIIIILFGFLFLSIFLTAVDAFKNDSISETILRRLLNQDIVRHIRHKGKERDDPSLMIFEQGKPVDFFVLILEGRVEVTVGKENMLFEGGPFTYFGIQALVQNIMLGRFFVIVFYEVKFMTSFHRIPESNNSTNPRIFAIIERRFNIATIICS